MKSIFKIISFTKHLWKWYLFMGFFILGTSLLSLVAPILTKHIIDIIVRQITGKQARVSELFLLLILIISTDVFISIFTSFSQWVGDVLTVRLHTFLSQKFYQHILDLHIGYFDKEVTGNLVNKMYRGITSITEFVKSMLENFLPFFLTAFVTIILIAYYSPVISLLLAILFPAYILISHKSSLAWEKYEAKKNYYNDISQGRVFESLVGIRVVKAFAAQVNELVSFLSKRKKIEDLTVKQTKEWHFYDFVRRFCLNLILFAIFTYIVIQTFYGKFTIGEMTLLLQLVNQARFPLFAMSFILGQIQQASAGSADYFNILCVQNNIQDSSTAKILKIPEVLNKAEPLIEFQNVSFNYENRNKVIQNISFSVAHNEKLALVGESGQGKSTIVNLLLRYYEPQSGSILIGGENIASVTQESLHSKIAVVFQESLLFSGTVRENIRYGRPGATNKEIIAASIAANAHEFITDLPDKYETLIGERGLLLSGGQKQRLAIARAFLKDAPIIVLDEATSSLDSKSEVLVQKGLTRLLKNRTSIIIAHRLSTIVGADHILVLHSGVIAEYGTSNELLSKNGLYAELVKLQHSLLKMPSTEKKKSKLQEFEIIG